MPPIDMDPYRRLAARVLGQAVIDGYGVRKGVTADGRAEAKAFLHPSDEGFVFWCQLIELDPGQFARAVRQNGAEWASRHKRVEAREERQAKKGAA
jgi:hypothetical protein